MNTKKLLSIAIIAALPCVAIAADWSDYNYNFVNSPATVQYHGNMFFSQNTAPYMTATITNDDSSHIASTAYVKGAYNDTIAALNRAYDDKQDYLTSSYDDGRMEQTVADAESLIINYTNRLNYDETDGEHMLISEQAVIAGLDLLKNTIDAKRVEIYTTWDNDNAKTEVPFVTASAQ